ncbi:aspartate aminotransferase family protein [Thioalbus denitrificans]|uniref:Glutamate-1-semialdehyde 2,1-aminomutase n=1 Tax=Thioalbus denitrificans TaxID=547122 RepID=A0A369CJH6_9GAMM|nr:aspartate aminotransferase family protein [Thioalbus denitrificans]RCX33225.1 glutamate-1-semialdehyde 2,1-aminomutase [Thioalbus denitrificans]
MPLTSHGGYPSEAARYRERTPRSAALMAEAVRHLPGGDTRSTLFYPPYPLFIKHGEGCWLTDVDGHRLLDLSSNHTALVHGNRNPGVLAAVADQLTHGSCFPGPSATQVELAGLIHGRIPSVERLRFTNSGTEATLNAVRAARAFTGRGRFAKMEGGYHGSQDPMMVSTHPDPAAAGPLDCPRAVPSSLGLAPGTLEEVLVLPFNAVAETRALIEAHADGLAAVIVEPVQGSAGMIPAEPAFLAMLREVTAAHGILLIFDEVVCFRLAPGGAQAWYGIRPDLTCLGKMIGGGFPLGVFGGRADVMAQFDPREQVPRVPHPGSLNANPVSLRAGISALEQLDAGACDRINRLGERLRAGLQSLFDAHRLSARVTGAGSLFGIHFTGAPVRSYREVMGADPGRRHTLFLGLLNEGVMLDPRGAGCVSTAMGETEVERFLAATRRVLERIDLRQEPVGPGRS